MLDYIIYQLLGHLVVFAFWFILMHSTGEFARMRQLWGALMGSLPQNNGVPLNATKKRG